MNRELKIAEVVHKPAPTMQHAAKYLQALTALAPCSIIPSNAS